MNITHNPITVTVDFATMREAQAAKRKTGTWTAVLANAATKRFELVLTQSEFAKLSQNEPDETPWSNYSQAANNSAYAGLACCNYGSE